LLTDWSAIDQRWTPTAARAIKVIDLPRTVLEQNSTVPLVEYRHFGRTVTTPFAPVSWHIQALRWPKSARSTKLHLMHSHQVLIEGYGRIQEEVHAAVEGLSPDDLHARPGGGANSIAWLIWHLTRVQDDHIADAAGIDQVWLTQGWSDRFALSLPKEDTGYGHTSEQVGEVKVDSGELLLGYYDAVHAQTLDFLGGLKDAALDRIVDENWDPPVTLGARLVSVLSDDLQHVGQAAYARGLL
jgi:uncharacterized damage-inducible protein DinB